MNDFADEIVLDPRKIALHYMRTWCATSLLALPHSLPPMFLFFLLIIQVLYSTLNLLIRFYVVQAIYRFYKVFRRVILCNKLVFRDIALLVYCTVQRIKVINTVFYFNY